MHMINLLAAIHQWVSSPHICEIYTLWCSYVCHPFLFLWVLPVRNLILGRLNGSWKFVCSVLLILTITAISCNDYVLIFLATCYLLDKMTWLIPVVCKAFAWLKCRRFLVKLSRMLSRCVSRFQISKRYAYFLNEVNALYLYLLAVNYNYPVLYEVLDYYLPWIQHCNALSTVSGIPYQVQTDTYKDKYWIKRQIS